MQSRCKIYGVENVAGRSTSPTPVAPCDQALYRAGCRGGVGAQEIGEESKSAYTAGNKWEGKWEIMRGGFVPKLIVTEPLLLMNHAC